MENLKDKIEILGLEIYVAIDHGECFYNEEYLNVFLGDLEKIKKLAVEYYNQNKKGIEEDK